MIHTESRLKMGVSKVVVLALLHVGLVMASSFEPNGGDVEIFDQGQGVGRGYYQGRSLKQGEMNLSPGASSSEGSSKLSSNEYVPPNVILTTPVPTKGVPTLTRTEFYTQGPVQVDNVLASAPNDGSCMTIGEVLKSIGATKWYDLLADAGFKTVLLDAKDVQTTLLVPVDESFFKPINAQPLRQEQTMDELTYYAPDIKRPLAGASILNGLWPSDSLGTSMRIPTSNSIGMNQLHVIIGEDKVLGTENGDNTANIVEADILACGPSIIHLTDNILLPFSFQDAPKDAITGQ